MCRELLDITKKGFVGCQREKTLLHMWTMKRGVWMWCVLEKGNKQGLERVRFFCEAIMSSEHSSHSPLSFLKYMTHMKLYL